ncbi:MAG: hypothetical protein JO060_10860 [Candidatus Eremiobacteraeota bacterium]|nr:hypothetical protein [Candidatus Eremiobacteraeota bacterium]
MALALGAWWYLRFTTNPVIAARFDQQLSVPIVVTGLASDETARYTDKQAVITIVAPRDPSAPVRPDDVRAVLNLSGRGPGVYSVPVTIIGPRLEVKSVAPADVTLQISRVVTRQAAVDVRLMGEGRTTLARSIHATPDTVTVRGASDDVDRVAAVRADVTLRAALDSVDGMARAVPVDLNGDEIPGVQLTPGYVRVRANFVSALRHG